MKYELDHQDIRDAVAKLCADFPGSYWQACDRDQSYPSEFVKALTEAGYLSALIPEEYGGLSLPISAAAAILEEVHRSGGNAAACHAQMYPIHFTELAYIHSHSLLPICSFPAWFRWTPSSM